MTTARNQDAMEIMEQVRNTESMRKFAAIQESTEEFLAEINSMADLFVRRREDLGLSMAAMERRLEVSPLTYRYWERGDRNPDVIKQAGNIAEALEISRYKVLAARGILSATEAEILEEKLGRGIPGYLPSHRDNAVVPLLRVVA